MWVLYDTILGPFRRKHFFSVGWLVVLRINVDLAIFQPYLDLEAGDNQSLKIQVARQGIEPRSSCSASQELNHSATAAPFTHNITRLVICFSGIIWWKKKVHNAILSHMAVFYTGYLYTDRVFLLNEETESIHVMFPLIFTWTNTLITLEMNLIWEWFILIENFKSRFMPYAEPCQKIYFIYTSTTP